MCPDSANSGGETKGFGRPAALAVGALAVAGIALAVYLNRGGPAPEPPQPPAPPGPVAESPHAPNARGLELWQKHCSACHGEKATGNGLAAYLLYPKPRDLSNGTFLLTSTDIGLPSDEDLLRTLRKGMPGSAMPSWGHLSEEDLKALVATVRYLAIEGKVSELTEGEGLSREEALEIAHEMLDPGTHLKLPAKPADVDLDVAAKIYLDSCEKCHDKDGRGREKRDMKDEYGNPSFARDFTQGIFKGGSDDEALAMRLVRGLPGSPMPGTEYTAEQLWSTVRFIQLMIKPGAQERVEQRQQTLTAKRFPTSVPLDPGDAAWGDVKGTYLAVMPLWWRHERIEGVTVQAGHDGSKVAVRLSWDDATGDDQTLGQTAFSDGVAVQLSADEDPPFFAMGAKDAQVDVWFWRAARQRDKTEATLALKDLYPNMPNTDEDAYPGTPKDEIFKTALGAGNPVAADKPSSAVENLHAQGFGTLTHKGPAGQNVQGTGSRAGDSWQVVFARDLKPTTEGSVKLDTGQTVHVAFAVWDGHASDRNGQKSVTIWHRLELEE